MQITIVQTEIEEAIRNYILGQISVHENHRIDIDLKATRGEQGFQAVIDIVPNDDKPSGSKAPTATKAAPAAVAKAEPAASTTSKASTASVFKKPKAEALVETTEVAAEEPTAEVPSNVTPITKAEEPAPAAEDAEAPRSIFSNLRKPVNAASA